MVLAPLYAQDVKLYDVQWKKIAANQKFPEGPAMDENGNLYASNCYGNWITRISGNKVDTFLLASDNTFKQTNGLKFDKNGNLFGCDFGFKAILKISKDGKVDRVVNSYLGHPFNKPNDLIIDEGENIYFSDTKSYNKNNPDGRLYYYDSKSGVVTIAADSIAFPNGIAITKDGRKLYLSESARQQILSFDISKSGELSNKKVFVELPGSDPDGLEVDSKGNVWVAHFGSGFVVVVSSDGKILTKIKAPGKKPSNLEFGKKEEGVLYLTEVETNSIYQADVTNIHSNY